MKVIEKYIYVGAILFLAFLGTLGINYICSLMVEDFFHSVFFDINCCNQNIKAVKL